MQAYSDPRREDEPTALPDLEVWYATAVEARQMSAEWGDDFDGDGEAFTAGWYWWSCFPGCLPDGEPQGPFATEAEALADAREGMED